MPANILHGGGVPVVGVCAHDRDAAFALWDQANDGSQQDRFAAARYSDQTEDFTPTNVERKPIEHLFFPESNGQVSTEIAKL